MEEPSGTGGESPAPSPAGASKSKLDTLPKDDLIKFAKKQMALMQKMKGRCGALEKEVESLKQQSKNKNGSSDDSTLIQELTERMDALLLEKAETQQSLSISRKDLEKTKLQAKDDVAVLQGELERAESASAKESTEEVSRCLEAQLEALRSELEAIQEQRSKEIAELQENHQKEFTKAQQEVENLKEELSHKGLQHEEEMRALEEDCEIERDRLLLLHEELTEQLALKDSFLQDVQEEDEEAPRSLGIAKMLELSTCSQGESTQSEGEETETGRVRAPMEDLQAQNTMLQDELTLLSNVKGELEAELEKTKEEFQTEKEEMEFKINELQMNKDILPSDLAITLNPEQQDAELQQHSEALQDGSEESAIAPEDQHLLNPEELRAKWEALTTERDSAVTECQHVREVLQGVERELGEKTQEFVLQHQAMKEQGANTVQELQDKMEQLSQEREELHVKVNQISEEKDTLMKNLQDLQLKLEDSSGEEQKLQSSVEEHTALVSELKPSVEEVIRQNEEILSQLHMKENMTQDLKEMVNTLTEERDRIESQLQHREEEMEKLSDKRETEIQRLLEEKEKEALVCRGDREQELKLLEKEKEDEVQHLKEERERMQETASALELTIKDRSTEKADFQQKLEEASTGLSKAQEAGGLLASKLADLEAQLEQETSEKNLLEAKLNTLTEDTEQARATITALEETHSEALRNSTEEVEGLRSRVGELEKERELLRSSVQESERAVGSEEVEKELHARIADLEQEKDMLRNNLEEVVKDTEGLQKDLEDMKSVNEKMNEENQRLQTHMSLRTELKDQLTEKDSIIAQLRGEIAALQDSAVQSASSEENAASETTKKIALLVKEHKEKDEKMNKIKAVAIKAKKELEISKKEVASLKEKVESLKAEKAKVSSSMKDIIHGAEGYKNLQIDYDRQTEQLDKEREKVEEAERQIAELTKRFSSAVTQIETLSCEKENLLASLETTRSTVRQQEAQNQELQRQSAALERDLLAERLMKEQKIKDLSSATKELEELTEAQQSSLLDMEMADYERLVKELNAKLVDGEECAVELKAQINTLNQKEDTLKQEIQTLKSQLDQGEEKTSKMKQLLMKTKKELADAKMQESSLMMLQASLKGDLEANQQQLESSKIEACELMAEDIAKAELMSTTNEFEGYKVRVHNVLKQQKSKTTAQSEGDSDRTQLSSESEHDALLERHNRIFQETVIKEAELRERLLPLQAENMALRTDLTQAQADLSSQVEAQRQTYREQLRKLQDDHRATVETLQGQLTRVEEQLYNLQSQNNSVLVQSSRKSLMSDSRRNTDPNQAGLGLMTLSDLQSMAREEGEGMETTETENSSPARTPLPSLEQLLTSPNPKQEPFVWTVEPTKEELSQKLSTATRSMEHMNGLLHETEATNAVLMEQITVRIRTHVHTLRRHEKRLSV
ncbi:hypothetical protein JOQ06_030434 [Pogonophryne albipinna]|uniref:GCC2 Rab binding domain-containing protein n=1 Tax=Pogonophryne albipinna TaxID=1090488 RepID=A0AAD6AZK6_9TELE|nr:hypothetical protein JOQ06_030434 [Pogonophryne albipinna]